MGSCLGCEMWITQHRLEPSATGFQPESLLALVHGRVGCCVFLALDRTVLTRGAGKKTGSYSLWSSWSWKEGVRTCPRDPSVTGQPWQDGKQQECWPGSVLAALWEPLCPSCWALQNQGVFLSPSPFFLPPLHHLVLPWGNGAAEGSLIWIKSLKGGTAGIQRALGNVWELELHH